MAWKKILLCLAPVSAGGAVYALLADATLPIVRLEFAWSAQTATELTRGRLEEFQDAITADYVFIVGYTATIILACLWGWGRRLPGVAGCVMAVAAAACDVLENLSLQTGLTHLSDTWFERATVAAGAKFTLVCAALVLAIMGLRRLGQERP